MTMRMAVAALVVIGCGTGARPAVSTAGSGGAAPRPLLAVYRTAHFGSDVPELVVYEDGLILSNFVHDLDDLSGRIERRVAHVTRAEAVKLWRSVMTPEFARLPGHAEKESASDLQTVRILARTDAGTWKVASVYGFYYDRQDDPSDLFATTARRLHGLVPPHGWTPWHPPTIELRLSRWDDAQRTVPWPDGVPLPPPDAPEVESSVRYEVPGSLESRVRDFRDVHPGEAVIALERKWSLSVRVSVPAGDELEQVILDSFGRRDDNVHR